MKTNFLLPVMAMIFAIGMSFATIDKANDPTTDYILKDGIFEPIGMELKCNSGPETCEVQLEPTGTVYKVYDAADPNSLKPGDGNVTRLWE